MLFARFQPKTGVFVRYLQFIVYFVMANAKSGNVGCLYIIHGYGSSGRGGGIREKGRQWLHAQARNGTVKAIINGEDFDIFNAKARELKSTYKELEQLLKVCNHGVTVVEL